MLFAFKAERNEKGKENRKMTRKSKKQRRREDKQHKINNVFRVFPWTGLSMKYYITEIFVDMLEVRSGTMNEPTSNMMLVYCELMKLYSWAGLPDKIGLNLKSYLLIQLIKRSIWNVIKVNILISLRN